MQNIFRKPGVHGVWSTLITGPEKSKNRNIHWQSFDMAVQKYLDIGEYRDQL